MQTPEEFEKIGPQGKRGVKVSRRFFLTVAGIVGGSLVATTPFSSSAARAETYWRSELVRLWWPASKQVADKLNLPMLDDPNGGLVKYERVHTQRYGYKSGVLLPVQEWSAGLRELNDDSSGYCARAAAARILFPQPSLKTLIYEGIEINYIDKMALLTALATQAVPLGLAEYKYGSSVLRDRLLLFANGTASYPFEVNRLPEGKGSWLAVCGDVSGDLSWFETDNFGLGPVRYSPNKIVMTYDPYLPVPGQIPAELRGEVEYWQSQPNSKAIRVPVDPNLVFEIVYGQPLAWVEKKRLMISQRRKERYLALNAKDFSRRPAVASISMDSPIKSKNLA